MRASRTLLLLLVSSSGSLLIDGFINGGSRPASSILQRHGAQQHLQSRQDTERDRRLRLRSSTVAPPKAPKVAKRTGGGDGDGLRPMTAAQVKEALANYKAGAFKYCQSSAEQKEQLEMISMMREWADTFEKYKRIGCKKMTLGSYRAGRLLSVAALQIEWRGFPERDVRMVVRLLALNPMHDKRIVGFEMMESLKALGRDNALLLDCSALREVPCLRVFALGSIRTLDADPELVDPRKLFYKSHVKRTCFVLDNIPEWADLGPFWFEGTTHDGVSFWFRKRTPMLLNEFEISWDHPKAGNATGSGTVGGARVIGIGELDQCKDIKGWAKVRDIQRELSRKLQEEATRSAHQQ